MRYGPSKMMDTFEAATPQNMIKWLHAEDTKLRQVEGRPVVNIFLDKVSMSSLNLLLK